MQYSTTCNMQASEYYHGLLPRGEAEEMLSKDGEFLARKSEVGTTTKEETLVLSVMFKKVVKHILINHKQSGWLAHIHINISLQYM